MQLSKNSHFLAHHLKKGVVLSILLLGLTSSLFFACGGQASQKSEGIIRSYIPAKPKSFDPTQAGGDRYSNTVVNYIFDPLIGYDYFSDDYALIPIGAESMPSVSSDNLTYTFTVRKGMYYYDSTGKLFGKNEREVLAKDYVLSLLRLADNGTKTQGFWLIAGIIEGLDAWNENSAEGGDYDNPPSGIKLIDDYSFSITLTKPFSQMLYVMTMNYTAPLPQEYLDYIGEDLGEFPLGSGPYYLNLDETISSNKYVLSPNPHYRKVLVDSPFAPSDIKGMQVPLNSGIELKVLEEAAPTWLLFKQGLLDLYSPGADQFDQAIVSGALTPELKEEGYELFIRALPDITYGFFNHTDDPVWGEVFADEERGRKVRQAMMLAYDTDTEIEVLRNGRGVPAQTPVPPGFAGVPEDYKNPYQRYDVEEAKRLLAEAGYPNGEGLPVLVYELSGTSKSSMDFLELFQRYMSEIGITVEAATNDWPGLMKKLDEGTYQYGSLGWGADYPDAQNFLQLLYGKNATGTGSNNAKWINADFDRLYEEALVLQPSPERAALYAKMIDIAVEDVAWQMRTHRMGFGIKHPRLKNYKPNDFINGPARFYQIKE